MSLYGINKRMPVLFTVALSLRTFFTLLFNMSHTSVLVYKSLDFYTSPNSLHQQEKTPPQQQPTVIVSFIKTTCSTAFTRAPGKPQHGASRMQDACCHKRQHFLTEERARTRAKDRTHPPSLTHVETNMHVVLRTFFFYRRHKQRVVCQIAFQEI